MTANDVGKKILDATHWVGAIKRSAEGSHMQLQEQVCPETKAQIWWEGGCLREKEGQNVAIHDDFSGV